MLKRRGLPKIESGGGPWLTPFALHYEPNSKRRGRLIDHFAVLCSVTRPLNKREAGVDLTLIQTSLLLCK